GGLFAAGAMRGDVGPRREGCYCCTLARAAVDSSSLVMLTCAGLNLPLTQTLPFAFSPGARSMVSIWPSYSPSAVDASCLVPSVPVMAKYSGLTFTTFLELLVTTTFTHVRSPPLDSTDGWAAVRLAASPIGAGLALPDSPPSAAPCTGVGSSAGTSHAVPNSRAPTARAIIAAIFFMGFLFLWGCRGGGRALDARPPAAGSLTVTLWQHPAIAGAAG